MIALKSISRCLWLKNEFLLKSSFSKINVWRTISKQIFCNLFEHLGFLVEGEWDHCPNIKTPKMALICVFIYFCINNNFVPFVNCLELVYNNFNNFFNFIYFCITHFLGYYLFAPITNYTVESHIAVRIFWYMARPYQCIRRFRKNSQLSKLWFKDYNR